MLHAVEGWKLYSHSQYSAPPKPSIKKTGDIEGFKHPKWPPTDETCQALLTVAHRCGKTVIQRELSSPLRRQKMGTSAFGTPTSHHLHSPEWVTLTTPTEQRWIERGTAACLLCSWDGLNGLELHIHFPRLSLLPDAVPAPALKFLHTMSQSANHWAPNSLTVMLSKLPLSIMIHLGKLSRCWWLLIQVPLALSSSAQGQSISTSLFPQPPITSSCENCPSPQ